MSCLLRLPRALAAAAFLLGAATAATAQPAVEAFFAGKQITLIVGSGPGGGYDLLGRLMSRHIGRHIPGNPTVIVQNMPGAGSLNAINHLANIAPKDGSVIGLMQRGMLVAKMINPVSARFELAEMNWIGSLNKETGITVAWHTAPHMTVQDLFDKELIVGGITNVDPETTPKLYNAVLGTKFKVITGYNSTAAIALAIERGEVQGIGDWSWSSIKAQRPHWIRDKQIRLLLQGAFEKDPELPNVPMALDHVKNPADRKVLELQLVQKTAARPVVAPPGIPADRIAALRAAFMALKADQEFLADASKSKLEVELISGAEVDKVIALLTSTPPDIVARYVEAVRPAGKK